MQIKDPDYWRKSAKAHAETLSKILWTGLLLSVAVCVVELLGKDSIKVANVDIPVRYGWIAFSVFTILHAIWTVEFVKSARRFWELTDEDTYSKLFLDITSEGGYFMRNMSPRILPNGAGWAPMGNELATWLAHLAALLLFFALISAAMSSKGTTDSPIALAAAVVLLYVNWTLGSRWAIALSELAVPKEDSTILARGRRIARRPRTLFDDAEIAEAKATESPQVDAETPPTAR